MSRELMARLDDAEASGASHTESQIASVARRVKEASRAIRGLEAMVLSISADKSLELMSHIEDSRRIRGAEPRQEPAASPKHGRGPTPGAISGSKYREAASYDHLHTNNRSLGPIWSRHGARDLSQPAPERTFDSSSVPSRSSWAG